MMLEKEDNFTWTLQMLLKLLEPNSDMPKVVVTDRDTSMMNAVANVLPDSNFVISMLAKMLEQESSPIAKLNKMLW